ncbi:ABC transporter substrate-binding protein [Microbacterium sp. MPKO10]|uniref:ABC transporter substrate-binding protein n=1 Tax=Microbacterium sp. MPKO10 TaxID=2989818 RepID=UPI00223686C0|nr:ABC transporter substrate-binding protein [Microbacterium sp. MPKO10]MCW4456834.1 ABC transporter substrate-binding protein [Microbacterium sp. MPKO10]
MIRRPGTVIAALGAAAALLLSGCSATASGPTDDGPVSGGDLVFARATGVTSLNTTTVHNNVSIFTAEQLMETLFTVSDDGKDIEPWLATGYEISDDELTYTVTLRDDVEFSNGQKLTAEDVKFSIDQDTKTADTGWGYINEAIKEVRVVDDLTVEFELKYVSSPFLAVLTMFSNQIVPKGYAGMSVDEFYENPIGTGPFVLDEWKKGQYFKVVRNENYWQKDKPYLDSVQWNVVADVNTRKLQLQGGQIDVDVQPDWSSFDSLNETPGIVAKAFDSTLSWNIAFNQEREPFDDVHVRRAIAYAVDRQAIVDAVLFGNGTPANSLIAPGTPYYDENADGPSFDLEKAKAELAKSEYPDGFSTTLLISSGNTEKSSTAQIIQAALKKIGITVEITPLGPTTAHDAVLAMDYDMTLSGWTMDIPDPDQWTTFAVDPAGGSNSDNTGYNNPEAIAINTKAKEESDPEKRAELYSELQRITGKDAFLAYLYYSPYGFAFSESVKGFHVTPLGNYHLEDVYISE